MTLASPKEMRQALMRRITVERCKALLIELVRVPSPQTELMEREPLLRQFIRETIVPKLRAMGFTRIQTDPMGNVCSTYGEDRSGRSLMLITNAMNQPKSTMENAYSGDVADGAVHGLPGEVVFGKGASEQKSNMTAMLLAMEAVIASGVPISGRLVHLCCLSGETGKHDAIKSIVESAGTRADMAFLGGTSLQLSLGNRGRIDVFIKIHGKASHSSGPGNGCNAITGATEVIRRLMAIELERSDPHVGPQSLTINHLRSFPDSTHTIQDTCEITVDRRLIPGEDPDQAFLQIKRAAAEVDGALDPASGKPFRVEVDMGPFMYPSLVSADSEVVRILDAASEDMLGYKPERIYAPNAFDQGYLNHIGIPTVNWGPGEYRYAHTDLDMASVVRVRDAALVYSAMMLRHLS